MSDLEEQPWSDNPNAPKIPYYIYRFEKTWFAGVLISSILYGTPKRPHHPVLSSVLTAHRDARRSLLRMHDNAF